MGSGLVCADVVVDVVRGCLDQERHVVWKYSVIGFERIMPTNEIK